uniref:Elongin C n=1 Tax=Aotus nancymaae TaxID=37293 RepID=A0A2K5DBA3_AOTNA
MDGEEKTYGGCEGPDAMYVKLISSDGHEFIVKREHALTSGTIKAMLSGPMVSTVLPRLKCSGYS